MKKLTQKPKLIKVRNKLNHEEIYWTFPGETKDIDGVTFIPVIKNMAIRDTPFWMRKDSMEQVK
jgi:hypothetical protein